MVSVHFISDLESTKLKITSPNADVIYYNNDIQALNAIEELTPSVVLLSYNFKQQQTPKYIKHLLTASPMSRIIIVGDKIREAEILACLISGAKGYQEMDRLNEYAEKLIRVIDAGEAWITRRLVAILLDSLRS